MMDKILWFKIYINVIVIYIHIHTVLTQEECPLGTTLNMTECIPCPSRCLTCQSVEQCTACKPSYWDVNNLCNKDCQTTCSNGECDDQTGSCKQCLHGYYGDACQYPCDVCEAGICDIRHCVFGCKERYFDLINYRGITICEQCTDGCLRCNADGCTQCEEGFYLTTSGLSCLKCGHHCTRCDSSKCTECVDGRYGENCDQFCSVPNCETCSSMTTSTSHICQKCKPGFVLSNGKCICSPTCLGFCTPDGACQGKCMDGYSGTYCNETCHSTCKTCDKVDKDICKRCLRYVYGDQCDKACSRGCFRTDNNQVCLQSDGSCINGCVLGTYGRTCNYKCPRTCLNKYCRQYEGTCVFGCRYGYSGPRCGNRLDGVTDTFDNTTYPTTYWMMSDDRGSITTSSTNQTMAPLSSNKLSPLVLIGIGIGLIITILFIILFVWFFIKSRKKRSRSTQPDDINQSNNSYQGRPSIPNHSHVSNGDVSNDVTYGYIDVKGRNIPTAANGYIELTPMATNDVMPKTTNDVTFNNDYDDDDDKMPESNIQIFIKRPSHNGAEECINVNSTAIHNNYLKVDN